MKVLVVGLGAVETVFSCFLKKHGHRVAGLELEPVAEIIWYCNTGQ